MIDLAIVDDDPLYRFVTSKLINQIDHVSEVRLFEDGEAAIDFLKACINQEFSFPDIILLDLNMPVMDGWEFIAEYLPLKGQITKPISIYIVTSSIDELDKQKADSISVVSGYMIKPVGRDQLNDLLSRITQS